MKSMQITLPEQDHCLHERTTSIPLDEIEQFVCMSCYHMSATQFGASQTSVGIPSHPIDIDSK